MKSVSGLSLPDPYRVEDLAFAKQDGLIPAVVQDARSGLVLMVGYCDQDAVRATLATGLATFYSRSRSTLWVKGESSGHTLTVQRIEVDCDADTLLLHCLPAGPTCHTGAVSCFALAPGPESEPESASESFAASASGGVSASRPARDFLPELDGLVARRYADRPEGSYTTSLFEAGVRRIAQKVGEEGVETALAAVAVDQSTDDLLGESADLIYHLLVLLRSQGLGLAEVEAVLRARHGSSPAR